MSKNITRLPFRPTSRRKVRVFKDDDCALAEVVSKEVSNSMEVSLISVVRRVIGDEEVNSVNARELHQFLGSKQDFSNWITNRITQYDLREGADFCSLNKIIEAQPCTSSPISANKREYILTLNAAKELSMVERTVKGKEARQYFIECERVKKELETPCSKIANSTDVLPDFTDPVASAIAFAEMSNKVALITKLYVSTLKDNDPTPSETNKAPQGLSNRKIVTSVSTVRALIKKVTKLEAEVRQVAILADRLATSLV